MKYLLTGTRVYGPARQEDDLVQASDLDIVLMIEDANELRKYLKDNRFPTWDNENQEAYDEGQRGYYFQFFNFRINIILAENDLQFDAWKYATEKMMEEPYLIPEREKRILTFKEFFQSYILRHVGP